MRFFKPREPFQVRLWAILGLSQKTINLARSIVTLVTLVSSKQGLSSSGSAGCWLLSSPKYFKNTKSRFFLIWLFLVLIKQLTYFSSDEAGEGDQNAKEPDGRSHEGGTCFGCIVGFRVFIRLMFLLDCGSFFSQCGNIASCLKCQVSTRSPSLNSKYMLFLSLFCWWVWLKLIEFENCNFKNVPFLVGWPAAWDEWCPGWGV